MMSDENREEQEVQTGNYQRESMPWWFLVGSIMVAAWVAYYIYKYWGGLGPGIPQ